MLAVAASAMFVAAACGSTGTATPTTGTATATPPASTGPTASPVPTANAIDITDTKYASQIKPAAKTGGTVVVSEYNSPDQVNPFYADAEADLEAFGASFDSMLTVTNNLGYLPDLASEVPTTDNGDVVVNGTTMSVTFKMKPNMKWSDGQPINCDDLIATWKWVMDKGNTGLVGGTLGWDQITTIGGAGTTTCVVNFKSIYEGYLSFITAVLPAHYISTITPANAATQLYPLSDPSKGVYSGPYIPQSYQKDAQVTLVANPNWATIGLGSNLHAPYLDKIIFALYGTPDAMEKAFTSGATDMAQNLADSDLPSLSNVPANSVIVQPALEYELLAFEDKNLIKKFGAADMPTIVKAIKLTVDRQAIIAGPMQGNVAIASNFVSPLTWYYKAEVSDPVAHPDQATTLLAADGWVKGSDGVLAKNGVKLELTYCSSNKPVRIASLQLQASELGAIGIKADIDNVTASTYFAPYVGTAATTPCNLLHGNFDVAEYATVSALDPLTGYSSYVSTQDPDLGQHNGANIMRVNNPDIDAAYNTVETSVDLATIDAAMGKLQDIYASDANTFEQPLFLRKEVWLVNPNLENFVGQPTSSSAEWNWGDWWVNS